MWVKIKNNNINLYNPHERLEIKKKIKEQLVNNEGLLEELLIEIRQEKLNKIKNNLK